MSRPLTVSLLAHLPCGSGIFVGSFVAIEALLDYLAAQGVEQLPFIVVAAGVIGLRLRRAPAKKLSICGVVTFCEVSTGEAERTVSEGKAN